MEWTLERVNGPRNFIVLDKGERSYPCGRSPTNKIVCQSLVVSRQHCIFVRAEDVISVIDLRSSNGIYVNRKLLEPNVLIELQENDIIGIGSCDEYRDNEPMFLFRLHKGNLNSRNLEEFDDLLTQRSSASSANVQSVERDAEVKNGGAGSSLKRNLREEIEVEELPVPPAKISKQSEGLDKAQGNDVRACKSEPNSFAKGSSIKGDMAEAGEAEEIEEIWSTLSSPKTVKLKSGETALSASPPVERNGTSLNKAHRLTLNVRNENEERKPLGKGEPENGESKLPSPTSTSLSDKGNGEKEEIEQRSRENKCDLAPPKQPKTNDTGISLENPASLKQKTSAILTSPDNSHRTIRFSLDSSLSTTRFTVNILEINENLVAKESGDKNRQQSKEEENQKKGKQEKKKAKSPINLKADTKCKQTSNGEKTQPVFKQRQKSPDIQRREETGKSSAELPQVKANGTACEMESNRFSFASKDPVATSSPFKLKVVKQEPMTSFSILDTVNLSDDDDDIFPSSQLFDSTVENSSLKVEDEFLATKTESIFEDDKNLFPESDAVIQESEEIITLSDSDDEDNPWLHRLSESQRIKEEEPEIALPQSPKMEFVDETFDANGDFIERRKAAQTEDSKTPKSSPKISPQILKRSPRSMTISEIEKDINGNEEDDQVDKAQSEDEEEFQADVSTTPKKTSRVPNERKKSFDESLRLKQGTPKGPEIIAPLRLPQRKRLSLGHSVAASDRDDLSLPSTSKVGLRVRDFSINVPKLPGNLTAKQKRELQVEARIKQKQYETEQRFRRIKNTWAQGAHLPLGKRKSPSISKKEKLEIITERKEKLKALANKQKSSLVKPPTERVVAKPKAKVSSKTRGDFLISEQAASGAKPSLEPMAEASTSKTESKTKLKSTNSTRSRSKSCDAVSKSTNSKKITSKETPREKEKGERKSRTKSLPATKQIKRTEQRAKSVDKVRDDAGATTLDNETIESMKETLLNQKENRVPNLLSKTCDGKKKKKVSFRDDLNTIKVYEIDPNNTMKKCTGKDALIPKDKMAAVKKDDKAQYPKLEEFLMHIFKWNPSWLEEQRNLKTEPPIVSNDSLIPLLTNYKSYKEYYQVMMPLLLLELWHGITKEFESIDKNNRRQTVFCSIVNNSVTYQPIPAAKTSLTTMLLEVLASNEDIQRQVHPVYGDLVFLELCYRNDEGKQNFLKVFAYVTQLYRTPITPKTFFNRDLVNYTTNPSWVLTYTVLTKPLKLNLCINRVLRLRCVTYLRANMRMVQALQSLPRSPLLDLIINPKVERYHSSQCTQSVLITRDKLNHKQIEAVFKTTEAIVRKEPKICLVQGPPGTGKSEVIVNMVMQVLYGDNRYRNKESSLRILLCAPSNAAIDEIVLRLLDRRAKLPNDRFKMVRVGLLGPMHPRVREISVEELARRDVKRTIASYKSCGQLMSSVDEEKRFVEARINALQLELNSSQQRDENRVQYTKMKLLEMRTRYDLINNCTQSTSNINPRDISKLQRSAESKILIGADIIACTLSSCYTNIMESAFGGTQQNISVCIVDEATQSCEAETLIPLMLGVNTLVLVGDPAQLPATIISQRAKKLGLDQSLFSRAQRAFEGKKNSPVIMLDVQYRMNLHISYWPNKYFYGGKLKNGLVGTDGPQQPILPFHPYRVVNLDSLQNSDKFSNTQEADFVANLVYSLVNHLEVNKVTQNISIGVITPYRNQQTIVQAKINQKLLPIINSVNVKFKTEVNTVDSFQGHERDIIIMSCVRTNGIGFLSDPQRLCVALTRAKHCLVLCGNFVTFQRDAMWRALLFDAQSRKNYIEMKADARPSEIATHLVR